MVVDNSTWGVNMRYESIPGHGWLQWHKLGSITYPTTGWYKFDGDYFYYENGEYIINTTRTINGVTYTFGSDGVSDKTPFFPQTAASPKQTPAFNAEDDCRCAHAARARALAMTPLRCWQRVQSERDKHEEQRMVCRDNGFPVRRATFSPNI